ncbi:hypothetical protein U9M48_025980 [Paspalum notatum var. saurae]|uniref:Uncharacterized protein n=1 Tax=Paspalum notatum var. saurae TaxID=547442 RepID=A0AAQ3TTQ6_PASNO
MHDPRKPHLALIKHILRYVKGTLSVGLHIGVGSVQSLTAYSDALGLAVRTLDAPPQATVSSSATIWCPGPPSAGPPSPAPKAEAEYRVVAHAVAECCWLRQLLQELHISIPSTTVVYCDNVSTVYMTANPVHHRRTKSIEIDIHFVREKVALGQFRVLHVPSSHQFADIMTKGLPVQLFTEFRSSLCVRDSPAATAGGKNAETGEAPFHSECHVSDES